MKIVLIECYIAMIAVLSVINSYLKTEHFTGLDSSVWTAALMLAWLMHLRDTKK